MRFTVTDIAEALDHTFLAPKTRKGKLACARLIAVTLSGMESRGVHNFVLAAALDRANMKKSTFYHYFNGLPEFFRTAAQCMEPVTGLTEGQQRVYSELMLATGALKK